MDTVKWKCVECCKNAGDSDEPCFLKTKKPTGSLIVMVQPKYCPFDNTNKFNTPIWMKEV